MQRAFVFVGHGSSPSGETIVIDAVWRL